MRLLVKVTSSDPRAPLTDVLSIPLGLDVWEVNPDHVVLSTEEVQAERLRQIGYGVEQLELMDAYMATFATAEAVAGYHSAESLERDLRQLAEREPEVAELREVGRSVEDRPIWALRLGERKGSVRKLLFLGCHHAREWISVEVPYLLADHLVKGANADPVKEWLSVGEIWIAPMVNPDGHEYCRTTDRLWRKNRRVNHDGSVGVDPNRNYGYMWGTLNIPTSSKVPSDDTYIGPRAFSEPETRAARDLIGRELFRGVLTYHSYSQLILYPWGHTTQPISDPAGRDRMETLAHRMRDKIRAVHDKQYRPQQSSELYPTAGDTTDWAYGIYDVPSMTIELRPSSFAEGGFILPPDQIQPTWEENQPAALEFIAQLL
jgi:carboxypeptidase T